MKGVIELQKVYKIIIITSTSLLVFLVACIKSATHQFFNTINWQSRYRSAAEWSFALLSAGVLATSATVELRLSLSKLEALSAACSGLLILNRAR